MPPKRTRRSRKRTTGSSTPSANISPCCSCLGWRRSPGGSGRSGAALAKEAAAAAAAAKAKKGGDDAEDEDDGKKDKKKTPPPPSPKKTRGRRGKKEDEEDEEKEDDEKEDDEKKKEKEKDVEMVDAEAPVKTRPKRAAASLKTLDATLFLEALMDAMESGKRPQAEAALHAIRVFIDGVMTLACDSAVVGVSEEDAADARAAVAAAEAAMKAEAEAKAAAEKARKEGKNPPSDEGASGEDADMQKVPEAKEEETKKEEEKEPKTTRSSKRGASSSKKSAKTDEEEEGEENDKADKEETSDKNKKAPEKEAGSERAAADAARATAAAAAAAALHAPVPPAMRSLVTELLPRLMHCCFQKSWQSTVGGVAGIDALSRVLPISALRAHLPRILHALLRALGRFPRTPLWRFARRLKCSIACLRRRPPRGQRSEARTRLRVSRRRSVCSPRSSSPRAPAPPCAPWWRRRWRG